MLEELIIKNVAIIDHQEVTFAPGLNVITGESGAGKSVVLHALELVLGAKPKAHVIRAGCDCAEVQARFSLALLPPEVRSALPEICEADTSDELCVTRIITSQGRGKIFVNGKLVSLSMLETISTMLMTICGQNQQVKLLQAPYHRLLLDEYCENQSLVGQVANAYKLWRAAKSEREAALKGQEHAALRKAELEGILADLSSMEIRPGLRSELEAQLRTHAVAAQLKKSTYELRELLSADDGIFSNITLIQAKVKEITRLDPQHQASLSSPLLEASSALEVFEKNLIQFQRTINADDAGIEELREQLSELARLERKYRLQDHALAELKCRVQDELISTETALDISKLEQREEQCRGAYNEDAQKLSRKRASGARELQKIVSQELSEVGMKGTVLSVQLGALDHPAEHGVENVEFLISPSTRSDAPRYPLREIASGGELSRVLLVLKKVLRDRSGVNVLVFDEVDTGISGSVARGVGEKLKSLAQQSQVVCITHLPQVASLADVHLKVSKDESRGVVKAVQHLTKEERVDEIARMLSGYEVTAASQHSARELLGQL